MIFNIRKPSNWLFLGVASAAIFFNFIHEAPAQEATGAWKFVGYTSSNSQFTRTYKAPPVCRSYFDTLESAVACLRNNNSWPMGWYTQNIGLNGAYNSYKSQFPNLRETLTNIGNPVGGNSTGYTFDKSGGTRPNFINNYQINLTNNGLNLILKDEDDKPIYDQNRIYLANLKSGRSGSSCIGLGNSAPDCSRIANTSTNYILPGNNSFPLAIQFFPNEIPKEEPDEGEDNVCEDTSLTLAMSAEEKAAKNPIPDQEFENSGCLYKWEKPRNTPENFASACLTPIGGETLCFAKGIRRLDPPAPKAYEEITPENPLTVMIGSTAAEQKTMKSPEIAKDLIGWGGTFQKLIPVAAQFSTVGTLVQAASNVSPESWSAWLNSFDEGLVKFELDYKKEQSDQDYYHPGNHTENGNDLGAFDRDWGKTEYDPDKAWNWNNKPAVEIEDTGKLAVIEQPDGPGSGGSGTYVTNINNSNSTTINYPPGVSSPGGNPTPPPDSSAPSQPGDGNPGDEEGEGEYPTGTRFYEPKYPDGLGGVWGDFKDDVMQKSGMNEFFDAFKMPTGVATSDLCFNFDFKMGNIIDLGEQGFCISENIILIVKALLIISAFLMARRLVFGG